MWRFNCFLMKGLEYALAQGMQFGQILVIFCAAPPPDGGGVFSLALFTRSLFHSQSLSFSLSVVHNEDQPLRFRIGTRASSGERYADAGKRRRFYWQH